MNLDVPEIKRTGNTYRFKWLDLGVEALVRRIRVYDSYTRAEVTWYSVSPGQKGHLHQSVLNLCSSSSKQQVARALAARHEDKDWAALIEQLAVRTLELHRQGEPTLLLTTSSTEADPIPMAIAPFIFSGQPFIFYGEPATAKSYIALLLLVAGATGQRIQGTPFDPQSVYTPLYLDWESTQQDQQHRLSRIERGLGVDLDGKLHYRRCSAPLAYDIDQIQSILLDTEANLVVIDSLGPAAGGDLNAPQSAQEFFSALRSLNCTSIILAHTAKNSLDKRRTVFGSQFFTALARGTAEVKRYQEEGEDEISIGIFHRKSNVSRLERPFGLRLVFDEAEGAIRVHPQDIRRVPEVEASLPVRERIAQVLVSAGHALPVSDVVSALDDVKAPTVRKTLSRMVDAGQALQLKKGVYAAATWEEDPSVSF